MNKKLIQLRISEDLHRELLQAAEEQHRSMANFIQIAILDRIIQHKTQADETCKTKGE